MVVISGPEGAQPGMNNKKVAPTAKSLLKGADVTKPRSFVNTDGMPPTASSLIEGAQKTSEDLHTKKINPLRLRELQKLAYDKGWTREQLDEAIRNELS